MFYATKTNNIAEVLLRCKPEKIRFIRGNNGLTDLMEYYVIGKDMEENEQIETMIHELLHHLPKYYVRGRMMNSSSNYDEEKHEALEREAQWIFGHRPVIKKLVVEKLRAAKELQNHDN